MIKCKERKTKKKEPIKIRVELNFKDKKEIRRLLKNKLIHYPLFEDLKEILERELK
jgi:hypothetical protein